jgi:hypothetical protein
MEQLKNFTLPKYGVVFLIFIITAKVLYLGVEVFYNGYLIDVITNAKVTKESLNSIESLGHNVSSVGLTLLFLPLFYLLYKKFFFKRENFTLYISVVATTIALFFTFHTLLTSLMDSVVLQNKDKRYSSYYISAFKYGMLNNSLGYESFIPKSHLENLNIEDKVMISNIFLLNYIDETLIEKLIKRGQSQFADVFILKYGNEKYEQSKKDFEKKAQEIMNGYNNYLSKSKEINKQFSKFDNRVLLDMEYQKFTTKLREKYKHYSSKVTEYRQAIDLNKSRVDEIFNDLEQYFEYSSDPKIQDKYDEYMLDSFGHDVEPDRWCEESCPSRDVIVKVIQEESYKKFIDESMGITPNLSQRGFFKNPIVRSKVIDELHLKGLEVSQKFNYSKKQFLAAYRAKVNKKFKQTKKKFLSQIKQQTGKDIKLGLNYEQFVTYFKDDLIDEYGKRDGEALFNMIVQRDISNFYSDFYKPRFKDEYLKKYILEKEDFDKPEHKELGDISLKHLFIPPFAIGMSLIAGMLNFVSVIVMILFIVIKLNKFSPIQQFGIKSFVKIVLIATIVFYPFIKSDKVNIESQYSALSKVKKSGNGEFYLNILEWIMVYEKINYKSFYPYVKGKGQELQI